LSAAHPSWPIRVPSMLDALCPFAAGCPLLSRALIRQEVLGVRAGCTWSTHGWILARASGKSWHCIASLVAVITMRLQVVLWRGGSAWLGADHSSVDKQRAQEVQEAGHLMDDNMLLRIGQWPPCRARHHLRHATHAPCKACPACPQRITQAPTPHRGICRPRVLPASAMYGPRTQKPRTASSSVPTGTLRIQHRCVHSAARLSARLSARRLILPVATVSTHHNTVVGSKKNKRQQAISQEAALVQAVCLPTQARRRRRGATSGRRNSTVPLPYPCASARKHERAAGA